jgi:AcrR family transcriptional regulator
VDSTRDRLVDAATELLDAGGPAAVTLREVGRRAGVSHNAPYKHFADKEDLLAAIAARELASQQRGVRRTDDKRPIDQLRAMMHGYVRWATRHPARFKLTFGAWSTDSDELANAATDARSALVTTVAAAQEAKELPAGDPERVAATSSMTSSSICKSRPRPCDTKAFKPDVNGHPISDQVSCRRNHSHVACPYR